MKIWKQWKVWLRLLRNIMNGQIVLGKNFVPHGDMGSLYRQTGLDSDSISNYICEVLRHEN